MTGRDGDTIAIAAHMSAIDQGTNQTRQIMRVFRITDPEVTIRPLSGAVPKVLGTYHGFNDQQLLLLRSAGNHRGIEDVSQSVIGRHRKIYRQSGSSN